MGNVLIFIFLAIQSLFDIGFMVWAFETTSTLEYLVEIDEGEQDGSKRD